MTAWAQRAAVTEDARTARLLDWVQEHVRPGKRFTDERVIVFTEYRATQRYLQERLSARGIAGDRVELLDGTTDDEERERIKAQWQEPPGDHPVRVLLATDAASEGISLQRQCHLLAHAEIPWNPNRLEQRNGRVDRHGQPAEAVLVHHLRERRAGRAPTAAARWRATWTSSRASCARSSRSARTSAAPAPVIAHQVEEAMLGRRAGARREPLRRQPRAARRCWRRSGAWASGSRACATTSTRAARSCT